MDAETVLFVDDDAGQVFKSNSLHEQRVRTDKNINFSGFKVFQNSGARFAFNPPGQQLGADADFFTKRLHGFQMLFGQNFGRRHNRGLCAAFNRIQHGHQRHDGFAAADVALQKPEHAVGRSLVGKDFL